LVGKPGTTSRRRESCKWLLWRTVKSQWSLLFLGTLGVVITLHKAMEMVAPSHPTFQAGLRFFDRYLALPILALLLMAYIIVCLARWMREIDERLTPIRVPAAIRDISQLPAVSFEQLLKDCSLVASAPASIFLFGEHAVMAGHPAVCLPIPKRVYVGVTFTNRAHGLQVRICAPGPDTGQLRREEDLEVMYADPLQRLFREQLSDRLTPKGHSGIAVRVVSEVPTKCGLGTSGAISAALAKILTHSDLAARQEGNGEIAGVPLPELRLAWKIESCFHGLAASPAGPFSALAGRSGKQPLVILSERRSRLLSRLAMGWLPVDLGAGPEAWAVIDGARVFGFDAGAYAGPGAYSFSIVYCGRAKEYGTVASITQARIRDFSPSMEPVVRDILAEALKSIPAERMHAPLRYHCEEVLQKAFLGSDLPREVRPAAANTALAELVLEGLGIVGILGMNSVLSTWEDVPKLMCVAQSLLSVLKVSSAELDRLCGWLNTWRSVDGDIVFGAKLTGGGMGGDVVVVSCLSRDEHITELTAALQAFGEKYGESAAVHFSYGAGQDPNQGVGGAKILRAY